MIKQISEALHYLHTDFRNRTGSTRPPIAHRDLKTENILFINSNQLVICDFAMSTMIQSNQNGSNQQLQVTHNNSLFISKNIYFSLAWNCSLYVTGNFSRNNRMRRNSFT